MPFPFKSTTIRRVLLEIISMMFIDVGMVKFLIYCRNAIYKKGFTLSVWVPNVKIYLRSVSLLNCDIVCTKNE
jgi:hypothetical protein